MNSPAVRLAVLACSLALAPDVPASGATGDWPGFLGPNGNLRVQTRHVPSGNATFALRTSWKKPLGSGYSGIAIAGDRVYTMFSDGDVDVMVCLDAATGEERWRHTVAPTWRGLQGSEDGPMSTPVIAGDRIVGLGPRGHLFALDRLTGEAHWQVDLVQTHRARTPVYGFASSPLTVRGERVVVQVGGLPEASIVAFELATGRAAWATASEPVEYQSAARLPLLGRYRLVGITATRLHGIDPENGTSLWTAPYLERAEHAGAHAIPTAPDRFLVNTRTRAMHYELSATQLGFDVRPLWTSRELKQSYAIPIYHGGHIYGYSGEFLTCVDALTGERVWKSRPPGKGALLLLNDLLIAWTIDGALVAIDASPAGYRQRARLQVSDRGSITHPSFSGGTIYVRNHDEIAAVEFSRAEERPPAPPATSHPVAASTPFTEFIERLRELHRTTGRKVRMDLVGAFLDTQPTFPIVEDENLVHFVYRGPGSDVALHLGSVSRRGAEVMSRIPRTDFWYRSYRLEPTGRYAYQFQLDYDRLIADPLNPRIAPAPGEFSELTMPGWRGYPPLRNPEADTARGTLDSIDYASSLHDDPRRVEVYLPHGYTDSQQRYPLLIVNGGDAALRFGAMDRVLDHVIGRSVEPLIVAFVTHPGGRTWHETGGPGGERYAWMVAHDLGSFLEQRYRIRPGREHRAITGTGLNGYVSLLAALRFPQAFGKVGTQSLYTHNEAMASRLAELIVSPGAAAQRIYMDWCTRELTDPGEGLDLRRDNARLAGRLQAAGHEITTREIPGGPGWGTWRAQTAHMLETLFPATGRD